MRMSLQAGDTQTYQLNFRVTQHTFMHLAGLLNDAGYLCTSRCRDRAKRVESTFKVAVCLYFMAGHGKGDMKAVADAGSISPNTVRKYLDDFCTGMNRAVKPIYMSGLPPSAELLKVGREEFAHCCAAWHCKCGHGDRRHARAISSAVCWDGC